MPHRVVRFHRPGGRPRGGSGGHLAGCGHLFEHQDDGREDGVLLRKGRAGGLGCPDVPGRIHGDRGQRRRGPGDRGHVLGHQDFQEPSEDSAHPLAGHVLDHGEALGESGAEEAREDRDLQSQAARPGHWIWRRSRRRRSR